LAVSAGMTKSSDTPDRGDVVWLDFSPQLGREQAGIRPALILSPKSYNRKVGLMLVCPITSKIKGYPFEVRIKSAKIDGVVLADQIKSIDWHARKLSFAGHAPPDTIEQTQQVAELLIKA